MGSGRFRREGAAEATKIVIRVEDPGRRPEAPENFKKVVNRRGLQPQRRRAENTGGL
jgi:hypothetical protein